METFNTAPLQEVGAVALPLTIAQTDIWNAQQLFGDPSLYNIGAYVELPGTVDTDVLRNACGRAVREWGALSYVFLQTPEGPRQVSRPGRTLGISLIDFVGSADPFYAASRHMQAGLGAQFDLAMGPMVRLEFLRISPDSLIIFFVAHHLLMDLYGGRMLLRRAAELYNMAQVLAVDERTPFTAWDEVVQDENAYRNSRQWQRDRDYWRTLLRERPAPVTLSGRHPALVPAATLTCIGYLPQSTMNRFEALPGAGPLGMVAVLHAAVALYLTLVSGNRDIVLGMAMSGRTNGRLRRAPGFLSNVVLLRLQVDPEQSFRHLLALAATRLREALQHQRYPASVLRSDLGLAAVDPPVYGTRVNFMPSDADADFGGEAARLRPFTHAPRVEDLSITVHAVRDGADTLLQFDGNIEHYDLAALELHRDNLLKLLDAVLEQPDAVARLLFATNAAQRRQLLEEWGNGGRARTDESLLLRLKRHALQRPDATAVVSVARSWSYAELDAASEQVSWRLRELGIGSESVVALWADRSVEMVAGLLGIWKAGAAYLALDPDLPPERLRLMVKDARTQILLGAATLPSPETSEGVTVVDFWHSRISHANTQVGPGQEEPQGETHSGQAAYLLYTSGSTGMPKAVVVTHAGIGELAAAFVARWQVKDESRVLQYASLGFDASVAELVTSIWGGATLVMAPREALGGQPLQDLLVRERISHTLLTPSVLATLTRLETLSLQYLTVGGEACPPALVNEWSNGLTMLNAYGPTECTVCATMSGPMQSGTVASIGRPLEGTRIYVLDQFLELVQPGFMGELYISGVGIARGYFGRPGLTASRFVADPFGPPGGRMYRTGDLVRWRAGGVLEYLGRADQQVKLRGQRIELGEVEVVLAALPKVESAIVVLWENEEGTAQRLVAYVVARDGQQLDLGLLRTALVSRLPRNLVPAQIICIDSLPRAPSGKLDRRALPAPPSWPEVGHSEPPVGAVETELVSIWKDLLQTAVIGRQDNFFELGGNSLLLIQLADRLTQRGWSVTPQALFAQPSVATLAVAIESGGALSSVPGIVEAIDVGCVRITPSMLPLVSLTQRQIDAVVLRVPGGATNVQDIYPLAPLQAGLLVSHRALEKDPYLTSALLEFAGRERLDLFLSAMQRVVQRHDALRTAIHWLGLDEPVQVVWRVAVVQVEWLAAPKDEVPDQPDARMDITCAPMIRVEAFPMSGEARWQARLYFHHLILDHESLAIVLGEVAVCMRGHASSLPRPVQYRHFVARTLNMSAATEHRLFFEQMMVGFREATMPFGIRDIRIDAAAIEEVRAVVEGELSARLRRQARRFGVAASSVFHLAWARLLGKAADCHDIVFGTVLSGRLGLAGQTSGTVGLCINTLPLRLNFLDAPPGAALLETHACLAELLLHEQAPLEAALGSSKLPSGSPLFATVLNFRQDPTRVATNLPVTLVEGVQLRNAQERTNYRLTLSVDDQGDIFGLTCQADASVGAQQVCQLMLAELASLATALEQSALPDVSTGRTRLQPRDPLEGNASMGPAACVIEEPLYQPLQGETEVRLAAIWSEVLRVPRVARGDDFFNLGGHSLLALQVVARIRDAFKVEIPLKALFDAATLTDLAARVDLMCNATAHTQSKPIVAQRWLDPAPLSYSQERMWIIQSMNPATVAYNMATAITIRGPLEVDALAHSVDELLQRHEVLRTRVQMVGREARQVVDTWQPGYLQIRDLRAEPEAEAAAMELISEGARRVFDLEREPVLRAWLLRTADNTYLFGLVIHHIASDQWSMGIFGREVSELYRQHTGRGTRQLAPIPVSYRDYSAWQREEEFQARFQHQLEFWRQQLRDVLPLNLPTDYQRPRLWTMNGAVILRRLPPELLPAIERLSRSVGATAFMTLFAGFASLLSRISGQSDIPVGVPVANRPLRSVEGLIGTFVNTIVLRADLDGAPPFDVLVSRIRDTALDAFANQDVPFDRLVQELGQRGDRSRAPLAQVMFNVVNAPMHGIQLDGCSWEGQLLERGGSQFELSITVDPQRSDGLILEYNSDLFARQSIERFADEYITLLEAAVAAPRSCITNLPIVPATQLAALRGFNATDREYGKAESTLLRLFATQVARTPERIAVSFEGASISYAELDRLSTNLSRRLRMEGAGHGAVIALCMSRSPALLVALLAVQKAGAAYLPIDPQFPADRIEYMIADSGACAVVQSGGLPAGVRLADQVVVVEMQASECSGYAVTDAVAEDPGPQEAAYILYTSGSTGRPKGVVVSHGALANFLCSMRERPGLGEIDVIAAVTTVSFDIAGLELYLPLIVGARVEMVSQDVAAEGNALRQLLERGGVTLMQATPATWRMLIEAGWSGSPRFRALCGGEALTRRLADQILERAGELWNMYGPTETTIWSSLEWVARGTASISIGRPIANTQIHVVDASGAQCPVGVPGEICIGGDGVALGYHARPSLTAERFVADRYARVGGRRLYCTGDLGRWSADGKLFHLGRLDHQVKVRGFRIELGEIEHALVDHPAVLQAVAAVREARPDDLRLVAYVVFREYEQATVTELKSFLRERLPEHAVPSICIPMPVMPLTPNGKVDRAALPDPFLAFVGEMVVSEPLNTETERQLAAIWKEILCVSSVGPDDNFFELGGHSLLSLQVARLVERRTGRNLDPRLLFFSNLREIARLLDGDGPVDGWRAR